MKNIKEKMPKILNDNRERLAITIWGILKVCFNKKGIIFIFTVLITLFVGFNTYYQLLKDVTLKYSVLNFTLMFDGISNGEYPNGSKFIDTDIIAMPILIKVYKQNNLGAYYGSLSNFANTISIQRYNPGLAFLSSEYKTKLENKRLNSANRYELEQEFYRQTADLMAKPHFSLVSVFPNAGRKYNVPNYLINKILGDILKVWLDQAKNYQGVTKYNVSFLSNKVEKEFLEQADYFSGSDFLRQLMADLTLDIEKVENLPNAKLIKIKYKNKTYTLKDLRLKVKYINNYIMTPLFEMIKNCNAYKSKEKTIVYLDSQIDSIELKRRILIEEKENYERLLLDNYIDSPEHILLLNNKELKLNSEILFYKKFLSSMKYSDKIQKTKEIEKIIEYQSKLLDQENQVIELLYLFYENINEYTLNTNSAFYKINWSSSYVVNKLNKKLIYKKAIILWAALEAFILLVVIGFFYLKEENDLIRDQRKSMNEDGIIVREYIKLKALPSKPDSVQKIQGIPEKSESLENRKRISKSKLD